MAARGKKLINDPNGKTLPLLPSRSRGILVLAVFSTAPRARNSGEPDGF
jgi:hypothetical protein